MSLKELYDELGNDKWYRVDYEVDWNLAIEAVRIRINEILSENNEICNCICHRQQVLHAINCCYFCESCGQNITVKHYENHLKKCKNQTKLKDRN